jgi:hypothetical protein
MKKPKKEALLRLHSIQMSAIFLIFEVEKCQPLSTFISALAEAWTQHNGVFPRNHLIELLTGEGKSVILAVVAAVLALLGYPVDIVCYSRILTDRDEEEMRAFYVGLGLFDDADAVAKRSVRYLTFHQVLELRMGQFKEAARSPHRLIRGV